MISGCYNTEDERNQFKMDFPSKPILLVSGAYNLFNTESFAGGVYAASGLKCGDNYSFPIYLGSSQDIRGRILRDHIPQLNSKKHVNPPLQHSWNKYGQDNFVWFLVEEVIPENLLEREQYYLDTLRPFADEGRGFNIAKNAASPMKGRKHSAAE